MNGICSGSVLLRYLFSISVRKLKFICWVRGIQCAVTGESALKLPKRTSCAKASFGPCAVREGIRRSEAYVLKLWLTWKCETSATGGICQPGILCWVLKRGKWVCVWHSYVGIRYCSFEISKNGWMGWEIFAMTSSESLQIFLYIAENFSRNMWCMEITFICASLVKWPHQISASYAMSFCIAVVNQIFNVVFLMSHDLIVNLVDCGSG